MRQAAEEAGATIVDSSFHRFLPHGISGVVVIAESHLAIHTWPEYGYAAIDLFTCGDEVNPWKAFEFLRIKFDAKKPAWLNTLEEFTPKLGFLKLHHTRYNGGDWCEKRS